MMGAVGFYTILAGAVVVLFAVFLGAVFIWPLILSGYRRYPGILFPRASLRVQTLREEVQANGWRWLVRHVVRNQRSLLTYWSFVWVIPLGFLVVAAVATLDLPVGAPVRPDLIQHGWQAQLTITSLSFIVLIFLLEQISRMQYREGVIQEFFASSRIMPVIYFTLAASGLVAYFHFVQPAESMAALIDATFIIFIGTILGSATSTTGWRG